VGIKVAALSLEDKAQIINEKLEKLAADTDRTDSDDEVLDAFNKIKSGEASRMAQK